MDLLTREWIPIAESLYALDVIGAGSYEAASVLGVLVRTNRALVYIPGTTAQILRASHPSELVLTTTHEWRLLTDPEVANVTTETPDPQLDSSESGERWESELAATAGDAWRWVVVSTDLEGIRTWSAERDGAPLSSEEHREALAARPYLQRVISDRNRTEHDSHSETWDLRLGHASPCTHVRWYWSWDRAWTAKSDPHTGRGASIGPEPGAAREDFPAIAKLVDERNAMSALRLNSGADEPGV